MSLHIKECIVEGAEVLLVAEQLRGSSHPSTLLEVNYRRTQGTTIPVLLSISRIYDHGESIGLVLIAHDLTERRELMRKFEESQEKYQNIVESSLDGIVIVQDGRLVFVNSSAMMIFGYGSVEEMKAISFTDTVAPASRFFVLEDYRGRRIARDSRQPRTNADDHQVQRGNP